MGNIICPPLFWSSDTPDYSHGYIRLLSSLIVAMIGISSSSFVCYEEYKLQDSKSENIRTSDEANSAFSDLTEVEKKGFRYIY
jgi:Ser-tRNA(Ala) deacylase AlaX